MTPLLRLAAGAVAGTIAMSATYPLDMVRGRLTVQLEKTGQYKGIVHCARQVVAQVRPLPLCACPLLFCCCGPTLQLCALTLQVASQGRSAIAHHRLACMDCMPRPTCSTQLVGNRHCFDRHVSIPICAQAVPHYKQHLPSLHAPKPLLHVFLPPFPNVHSAAPLCLADDHAHHRFGLFTLQSGQYLQCHTIA